MAGGILPLGNDITTMNPLPALSAGRVGVGANIESVAQEFEAMFATQLLQPMFDTVPVNSVFGGGHGEEVMRSFMLQEYGKMIAKTGRLGIASQVKAEMLRAQESAKTRGAETVPAKAQDAYVPNTAKAATYVSQ